MAIVNAGFGTDLWCVEDLDEMGAEVAGTKVLQQALARRLMTPRGRLIDDESYGIDIREYLSDHLDATTLVRVQAAVRAECLKDPRVLTANIKATVTGALSAQTMELIVDGESVEGPYALVLAVTSVTVALLKGNR